jgi:cation-transporting ATPase 13A2
MGVSAFSESVKCADPPPCRCHQHIGVDPDEIAVRSLDVLTIAVPPALPAALSVATTFAIARLKRKGIFCTSPQRINVAGMITAVVFDKTGTLTEEGLSVLGVCEGSASKGKSFEVAVKTFQEMESVPEPVNFREALATTHDVNTFEGKLLGEPLEAAMFEWTGATLQEDEVVVNLSVDGQPALTRDGKQATVPIVTLSGGEKPDKKRVAIVSKFDFSSNLRRMSVIVKGEGDLGAQVYVKGAPEVIGSLCRQNTFPARYEESLDQWTRGGYRVIALAGKRLEGQQWTALSSAKRDEVECDLTFLGLLIFENKLKDGSKETIRLLNEGSIITKMCTGDAPLTAVAVAKESGLIGEDKPVYMARISGTSSTREEEDYNEKGRDGVSLEWVDIADPSKTLDPYSLQPLERGQLSLTDIGLCISGETYSQALSVCALETMERLLVSCQVFARFSPEQKQDLVERLQTLDYLVAFAGDGANDMGGLKSADVGVSLSQAEASVAAPFTSEDIRAVEALCREGRNAVTSCCNLFNFMIIYSLTEYFSVLLLYGAPFFSTSFNNANYLYIDIFLVFPFAIGMSASRPSKKLSSKSAHARIISRKNLVSIFSQFVLLIFAQVTIFLVLHNQSYYQPPADDPDDLELDTQDNTVLFKTSIFTYLYAAIIWNFGPPHRQILPKNYLLMLAITVLTALDFYFLFTTSGTMFDLFGFQSSISKSFLWIIFGVIVAQFVFALGFELFGVDRVAALLKKPTRSIQRWYSEAIKKKAFHNNEKRYRMVCEAIRRDPLPQK